MALAISPLLAAGCRKSKFGLLAQPRQIIDEFTLKQSDRNLPSWDLYSPHAQMSEETQRAALQSPKLQFYKDGKLSSVVTSLTGDVGMKDYDVTLSSDVVAHTFDDETTLNTEELKYSNARKKVYTDKDVLVNKPEGVLHGQGLEANPDLSEIRIFKQRSVLKKESGS